MKKLLVTLLAGVMLLSAVGCGAQGEAQEGTAGAAGTTNEVTNEETPSGKTKIRIMVFGSLDGKMAEWEDILALDPEMDAKYEVELISGGANIVESMEKARLALASGESICDIMRVNYSYVPELARAGVLYDLSDAIAPYEDNLVEAAKMLSQYEGKTVGIPSQMKTRLWFYRQDIFEECGIDATQIKTTDDFIAAGKKIREKYPDTYMMNLGHAPADYNYFLTLSGNGASFCDADGNYNISSNEGVIKCLEDYKKIQDAGLCMDVSDWTPDWENAFANDQLISCLSASWLSTPYLPNYAGEDDAGKWAATLWPEIGGSTGGSDGGGSVYIVPNFSSHPEEAAELVAWHQLSEVGELGYYEMTGSIAYIANKEVLKSERIAEDVNPYFTDTYLQAQIDAADAFGVFNYTPNASAETTIALEYFTKAVYGEMSIADALKAAEDDMKAQLGNAYN